MPLKQPEQYFLFHVECQLRSMTTSQGNFKLIGNVSASFRSSVLWQFSVFTAYNIYGLPKAFTTQWKVFCFDLLQHSELEICTRHLLQNLHLFVRSRDDFGNFDSLQLHNSNPFAVRRDFCGDFLWRQKVKTQNCNEISIFRVAKNSNDDEETQICKN